MSEVGEVVQVVKVPLVKKNAWGGGGIVKLKRISFTPLCLAAGFIFLFSCFHLLKLAHGLAV